MKCDRIVVVLCKPGDNETDEGAESLGKKYTARFSGGAGSYFELRLPLQSDALPDAVGQFLHTRGGALTSGAMVGVYLLTHAMNVVGFTPARRRPPGGEITGRGC